MHMQAKLGQDGEMSEMTLPSRHRIQNSNSGGLRSSTLPLGHGGSSQYLVLRVDGEETFLFLLSRDVTDVLRIRMAYRPQPADVVAPPLKQHSCTCKRSFIRTVQLFIANKNVHKRISYK